MRFLHPLFLTLSKFPDSFANLYDGFIFTHQILTIIFWVLRSRSDNLMPILALMVKFKLKVRSKVFFLHKSNHFKRLSMSL